MMTHDNTSRLDIVFLHHPLAASILKATNQPNKTLEKAWATYPSPPHRQSRRENRHRRCAAPNLPSFVLLNWVMVATLAVTPAPTALAPEPALAFVPDEGEEEGKDDDIGPDRSSIGGKRSLSMSDLRLWVTTGQKSQSNPQIRRKVDNARVVERLDRVLDALCPERERAVREPR